MKRPLGKTGCFLYIPCMKWLLVLVCGLVFLRLKGSAQKVVDVTRTDADVIGQERVNGLMGGQTIPLYQYVKLTEGTPFYKEDWSKGVIVLKDGHAYRDLELKLDLLHHEVHYKAPDGSEMIATAPIQMVSLDEAMFIPGTPWKEMDKMLDSAWLRVLVNNKVSLLLEMRKKVRESTPYGSATTEEAIIDEDIYYLQMKGQLIRIRSWAELPGMFGDMKPTLIQYIKEHRLRGRSPGEYAQLIGFCNTLVTVKT